MKYHHLSHTERDELAVLHSQGLRLREIAQRLNRSVSTLSRELRRNRYRWPHRRFARYLPGSAHQKAQGRLRHNHRKARFKNATLHQMVVSMLQTRWSPELIAGYLKRMRPDLGTLSPETIYQWIYTQRPDLIGCLVRASPKRRQRWKALKHRVRIPRRISIHQRPAIVGSRQEAGHWETDLIVGPGSSALQVLVERQTRYCLLAVLPQRSASISRAALTRLLAPLPAALRRSLTYDNGVENYEHLILNDDFGMCSYFCEPYHSWEKGTVENTNGLIRRFIPKHIPIDTLPADWIVQLQHWLNERPRKVLNYQTPKQAFQALVALAT